MSRLHAIAALAFALACAIHLMPALDPEPQAASEALAQEVHASASAGPGGASELFQAPQAGQRRARPASDPRQKLAVFLSERYSLAVEQMQEFVDLAYRAGKEAKIDPLLILAVAGVESSFDPTAQSKRGAQGLMQVHTRVHRDKFAPFGGANAAFDPLANMKVGAQILKDYLLRDGSIEAALKAYVGAGPMANDNGYGAKVLSERERLAEAAGTREAPPVTLPTPMAMATKPVSVLFEAMVQAVDARLSQVVGDTASDAPAPSAPSESSVAAR